MLFMEAEILFPEIRFFGSSIQGCSSEKQSMDHPVPKISKAKQRKIRLLKMKNSIAGMEATTHLRKSGQPVYDGSIMFDSSSLMGSGDGRKPILPVDSVSPELDGTPVSASQPQSPFKHYNLRLRGPRLL